MFRIFGELDRILRGDATRLESLEAGSIRVPVFGMAVVTTLLAMIYGACMGSFALTVDWQERFMQTVASTVKMPLLFGATLLVTFPSLYVFNALVGSRLRLGDVLRLVVAALAVCMAVLASLGPIVAFFSVTSTSYSFIVLLNVIVCAVSGFLGLSFMMQTLNRLSIAASRVEARPLEEIKSPIQAAQTPGQPGSEGELANVMLAEEPFSTLASPRRLPGPLEALPGHFLGAHVRKVFAIWIMVFGVVGAQMSWLLRPFIGDPDAQFAWFRPRGSNFFEAVGHLLWSLFLGNG
jgi:hypothetical protein